MNASIKTWVVANWLAMAMCGLSSGCGSNPMNTPENSQPEPTSRLTDLNKIIWTLQSAHENGDAKIVFGLPPFQLIYDEQQFLGSDGCNWFNASFDAQQDSIFPGQISQSNRACAQIGGFPIGHLAQPYHLEVGNESLQIFRGKNIYRYASKFTLSIKAHPLVQVKNWLLQASSDPEFVEVQAQGVMPVLTFNDDRTFQIVWNCAAQNSSDCDRIVGLFGIGKEGEIIFYQHEDAYRGQGPGRVFVQRVLAASTFALRPEDGKSATLILTKEDDGTTYQFVAEAK